MHQAQHSIHQQQQQQQQLHQQQLQNASQFYRGSPAVDSGAGSSRSDSPHSHQPMATNSSSNSRASTSQYSPSPCPSQFSDAPPPPPPRCSSSSTPSTPPPIPQNLQQHHMMKRMPPGAPGGGGNSNNGNNSRNQLPVQSPVTAGQSPARGTSPVSSSASTSSIVLNGMQLSNGGSRQPIIVQNGPQAQQQLNQQMQALSLFQSGEPPPLYPMGNSGGGPPPPPSYTASIQSRQSPTQSTMSTVATSSGSDYRKSPSSGIYSATSTAGSPSPITVSGQQQPTPPGRSPMPRPIPLSACGSRQTKTQQPIIMQSVKSTQVQKPVLQTATAPTAGTATGVAVGPQTASSSPLLQAPAPPSYALSIQQKTGLGSNSSSPSSHMMQNGYGVAGKVNINSKTPSPPPPVPQSSSSSSSSPVNLIGAQQQMMMPTGKKQPEVAVHGMKSPPNTEPPSYASTMQAILAQQQAPSPQTVQNPVKMSSPVTVGGQQAPNQPPPRHHLPPPPPYSTNTNKGGELGVVRRKWVVRAI